MFDLTDEELPEPFASADAASRSGQLVYLRGTRLRLIFAVLSAVLAVVSFKVGRGWDVAALLVAFAFVATLLVEIWMLAGKPERKWYDGRALAESTKTLAWRYAVAADPFTLSRTVEESSRHFIREVEKLIDDVPSDSIVVPAPVRITERMREVRDSPLPVRRDAYLRGRIENQQTWYSRKAVYNTKMADRWRITLIVTEGLGVVVAVLKAGGLVSIDLPGIVAAALGAGSAWFAARQHESLGRAYTFAANDLSTIYARLQGIVTEADWAREVANAEEAISREHTMWRASRGGI
ncbi:DUF4231 domain-containing protein [Streptomyces achromogenes]|uniref:DUF4231 domain-containing protein n=1 Tax=Streptomyces achromogenes TaxID=67255 RepID=UPI0033E8ED6B